jgi:dipeptidyl aminopeptidase/acylaminoacyl peptidase
MTFRLALLASASLFVAVPAIADDSTLATDARAFGMREDVNAMSLSPDGTKAVYIAPAKDRWSAVVVVDLVKATTKPIVVSHGDPEVLRWCGFASNDRLVCRFTANVDSTGVLVGFSRLISVKLDGSDVKELGQHRSFYDAGLRQYDGSVLDWRPSQAGSILMERDYVPEEGKTDTRMVERRSGLGVDLVDVATLKVSSVEAPRNNVADYMTDGLGNVRMMSMAEANGSMLTGRLKHFYRAQGSHDWQPLTDYVDSDDFQPLAVDATTNSLYALKKYAGRMALYRIKLDGTKDEQLVASNPKVDIDGVVRVGNGLKVIGYTYAEDKRQTVYFDPEFGHLADALSHTLPKDPLVNFAGASADGRKLLIFAGSDSDPGHYYLYDKQTHELNDLMQVRPALAGRTLAKVSSISYKAADGTVIPAYLTLPPGKEAKGLPAVVLPHGGPSDRDEWGFDWLPQFLAARGYAVIQPEYRGSGGFGDKWLMDNGFKSWRTSIGDIDSAATYLASSGIADPKRIAILGWSYGGYAALQAAATDPSLYKGVVAIAPVTDLALLKQESQDYTDADVVAKFVGSGPHVVEGSPLHHAADIKVPVLLVHGTLDSNVAYEESAKMESALEDAGAKSELETFKGLDHQLEDSDARTEMLTKIGTLLDQTIGH